MIKNRSYPVMEQKISKRASNKNKGKELRAAPDQTPAQSPRPGAQTTRSRITCIVY
jgi:hypothetical protein